MSSAMDYFVKHFCDYCCACRTESCYVNNGECRVEEDALKFIDLLDNCYIVEEKGNNLYEQAEKAEKSGNLEEAEKLFSMAENMGNILSQLQDRVDEQEKSLNYYLSTWTPDYIYEQEMCYGY